MGLSGPQCAIGTKLGKKTKGQADPTSCFSGGAFPGEGLHQRGCMFEGNVPPHVAPSGPDGLTFFDASGGQTGGLRGLLPPELGRLKTCECLGLQRQHLEGVIPYIESSLQVLALQGNDFQVFLGTHLRQKNTKICLFGNRLSCHLPHGSDDVAGSLVALNRRLCMENHWAIQNCAPFESSRVSIDRLRFGLAIIILNRFSAILYFTAIPLISVLLAAESLAIPGTRFWILAVVCR